MSILMNMKTLLKTIVIVIVLVSVWLIFNPGNPELRTKHKEILLKKGIEKSVEEIEKIEREIEG